MRSRFAVSVAVLLTMPLAATAQGPQHNEQATPQKSGQHASPMTTRSYQAVQSSLKNAGIQNLQPIDAAYLINATTKQGERVSLVVDPHPQINVDPSEKSQSSPSGDNTLLRSQQQIRQDLKNAGFSDIQFVEATYLATGTTKSGDQITMVIDPSSSDVASTAPSEAMKNKTSP